MMEEVVKKCDICQEQQHAHQCKDCGKDDCDIILLCGDCHHAIHRGRFASHKVEKAAGQEIRDFCSRLDTFKSKSSELKRGLEEVCNSRRDLLKYTQIHESHIKEVATKLQQKIKSQAEQLIAQVQQVSAEKNDQLSECEELCRNVMTQHEALCEEADEILGNPDDSLQDKTQKVAEFQGKLEVPSLTDLETKFPDIRIHLVCDVSSVLTAISEWQLTGTPAPPDNIAETEVGSTLQVSRGVELPVWVESRMSAKGIFYVRQELDVPSREILSALSLHIRRAGVLGTLGDWTGGEGSLCAVRHPGDMTWYRGLVEELRKDRAAVRLLDYGTVETVPLANLAELPANLPPLPFQAVACTFFKDETGEVPREARWLFSDLAAHKKVTCTFEREMQTDNPVPLWKVDLQDVEGGVNIAERIITAMKDKEAKSETVSCRDIRLKESAEDFVPGALTVIRTNAAAKDPSPEPYRSEGQEATLEGNGDVLSGCTGDEAVSVCTSMPPQVEVKTTSDFTPDTGEGHSLLKPTSVQDTIEAVAVSDKDVRTCHDRNDEPVPSATELVKEDLSQGADTAESLVPNKPSSGTGVFPGVPRILARGEPYFPPQLTSESVTCTALEPATDKGSSSQGNGADGGPVISAASKQFHHASREGDGLPSLSDMSTTERSQCGQRISPPFWLDKTWHAREGDEHVQQFHRVPGPQPPRSMYPPPGIPLPTAQPETYSVMNHPHHFTPIGGMPVAGDLTQPWQGNVYPYFEEIVSSCGGQVQPYSAMGDNTCQDAGAMNHPTTLSAPKMTSGLQDFGYDKSRDGHIPTDESLMSELTPCHGVQKTFDAYSSVSNGVSHLDRFSTKDRPVALASASNDEVIVSSADSAIESTVPVDKESCMVSSDKLYTNGTDDVKQKTDLPASVPLIESKQEKADQTSFSCGIMTKEEMCPTESTVFPSPDAVSTTSLSTVDASCSKERPGSNQTTGGNSLREDTTEFQPEDVSASSNSILEIAKRSVIELADKQHTEGLFTSANPVAMSSDAANVSAKPDSTSAPAMSLLYGGPATEVSPTESVNSALLTITAEEVDPQPRPSLTNGDLQHQNIPGPAALMSLTVDSVIKGEAQSDKFSPTSDEYASPLPVNTVLAEGDPNNSWVSVNESPGHAEDVIGKSLPRAEADKKCSHSVGCASTDVTETKLQPTGNAAVLAEILLQHIADIVDKTGETSSEGSAKLQDSCTATCSVGNSGEESDPSLCKSSGANCANDMPSALDEKNDNPGRLAMVFPEMQVAGDPAGIGTSSHLSHHQDSPPERPSCMETAGGPEYTGDMEVVEHTDKPAVVPRESVKEGFVTGANMKACVTHPMEPDGSFWIKNSPAEDKEYKLMMDEMRAEAPLLEALMEESCCSLGLLVCAVSAAENMWYRGKIEKMFSKTALVRFVDLGKAEEIAYVDIKLLPAKYQHMDFQVQRSLLAGVSTILSEKQVELFNKLTANRRTLWTQVTCVLPSGECTVRLWDESNDVELSINQQVADTLKADPGSLISVVQRSMPVVIPGAERLTAAPESCVYNQHGRGNTTRSLYVPGFQHGQFHSSPQRDMPAHLGAANMEPIKRPKSAPPTRPQMYLEDTYRRRERRASGGEAMFPRHLMGLLGLQSLTFQLQDAPYWSQREQQTREHLLQHTQKVHQPQPHPYPRKEKPSRSEQQHMERRPAQRQYIPPHLREGWQQKQQQTLPKSEHHKQLESSETARQQTRPPGTPYPRELSTVGEGSQMTAENKTTSMTSGSSEDWDDANDDWTEGNLDCKEHKQPVLQQPYHQQQLAEGTTGESGIIHVIATDETGADSTSVSGCSSPARSVQSAPSVFDEDDWVEGEDPLSQRSDFGSLQEATQPGPPNTQGYQPGPPNTQGYMMQSGDRRRQPAAESRSHSRNGTGARSRRSGACHQCGGKGHKQADCPNSNGRNEQQTGRKGGRGRKSNRW